MVRKAIKPAVVALSATLALSCATVQLPGAFETFRTCGMIENDQGVEISWKTLPIYFIIDESVPEARYEVIREAAAGWNTLVGREVIKIIEGVDSRYAAGLRNTGVIYYVGSDWAYSPSHTMVTTVDSIGDEIVEANISINAAQHWDSPYKRFHLTMMHEFGHALGMKHIDDVTNLMYYRETPEVEKDLSKTLLSFKCKYN